MQTDMRSTKMDKLAFESVLRPPTVVLEMNALSAYATKIHILGQ